MVSRKLVRAGLGSVLFVGWAAAAMAVPVDCTTLSTLNQFIGASDGCFVQDKLFTGFNYTGGGAVTANLVDVDIVFSPVIGGDLHGFVFTPLNAGVWTTNFDLGYTITVVPPNPGVNIVDALLQINVGRFPQLVTATSTKSNGLVQAVNGGAPAAVTDYDTFPGVQSLVSRTVVTFGSGGQLLVSLEENYSQAPTIVPEPTSMVLLGTGLIGAAIRVRRRRK